MTVLRRSGQRLEQVGQVGGLGAGEQIRSVRFLGATGYVVTFRQTDPLYTVDLADPARPRVTGTLALLGYSASLHPAGTGLLLGVGQDADGDGRVRGLQLSLFDVSDPAAPRRVAQLRLPQAWSPAESDQHAFTLAGGLVLVPFTLQLAQPVPAPLPNVTPGTVMPLRTDSGVLAVRLTGRALGAPQTLRAYPGGRATPAAGTAAGAVPLRTFVSGGRIWTVTSTGIATHDAATGGFTGFTPF